MFEIAISAPAEISPMVIIVAKNIKYNEEAKYNIQRVCVVYTPKNYKKYLKKEKAKARSKMRMEINSK